MSKEPASDSPSPSPLQLLRGHLPLALGPAEGSLTALIARGAILSLALQVTGATLAYALQVLLARWLDPSPYGIFVYATTWGSLLAIIAGLGLPSAVLRFLPQYEAEGDWGRLRGFLRSSEVATLAAGVFLAGLGSGAVILSDRFNDHSHAFPLILGLWLAPLLAGSTFLGEATRTLRHVGRAYAPQLVLRPLLITAGAVLLHVLGHVSVQNVLWLSLASYLMIFLLQQALLMRLPNGSRLRQATPRYETRIWLVTAMPLLLMAGLSVVITQIDIIILGLLRPAHEVGLYGAAVKTVTVVGFVTAALYAIMLPVISSLYRQGKERLLRQLLAVAVHIVFWPTLLIAVLLFAFGDYVLEAFGPQFAAAHTALALLAVGQLVNTAFGPVGYLLYFTGHERMTALLMGGAAILNVVLNLVLIPPFGMVGSAAATAATLSLWNVALYLVVRRRLGFRPSIFDSLRQRAL